MAGHPQGVRPRSTRFVAHRRIAAPRASLRRFATPTTEGVIRGPRHNPANSLLVVWWGDLTTFASQRSSSQNVSALLSAARRTPPRPQQWGCLQHLLQAHEPSG